jgi:hypothetical protein
MADEEQGQSSTEETTETTEAQDEKSETTEEQESSDANETEKYRKIADDQRKRAEKAEAELKKLKPKPETATQQNGNALSPEAEARVQRAELNGLGITNPDDQKLVSDAAKRLGISVYEAANDEFIAARLETAREKRKTKDATPPPTKGGGTSTANITRLAEKALQTGELPTEPKLKEQVKAEMRRISK